MALDVESWTAGLVTIGRLWKLAVSLVAKIHFGKALFTAGLKCWGGIEVELGLAA